MKKTIIIAMVILLTAVAVSASVGVKVTYFSPTDADFKSIYGGGLMYGLESAFTLTHGLDIWLDAGYFAKTGQLSFTKEETKLTLVPIGAGLRYSYLLGKIAPYLGAGVRYFIYKESNVLGNVNEGGIGFVGKVGVLISAISWVNFDLGVGFSSCKLKPADFEFNVGGLELSLAITF